MGTMNRIKRSYSSELKATAVLESMQRDTTIEAVCKKYGVRSSLLSKWRKVFKDNIGKVFEDKRSLSCRGGGEYAPGQSPDELKRIIGELTVENDILKKASRLLG